MIFQFTEEERLAVEWLSTHVDPQDQVKLMWTRTYNARQRLLKGDYQLHQYYQEFPCLKVALGAELLQSDFNNIHPNHANTFLERWDIVRPLLIELLNDSNDLTLADRGLLEALPNLLAHNQDAVIIYLLPYLVQLSPPKPIRGQRNVKLSIPERREYFLVHAETAADVEASLNRRRNDLHALDLHLQPIIVLVGPLVNLEGVYVYINESITPTIYVVNSVVRGIDLTFKSFFALQCSFPERASSLWNFIEKGFFDIELPAGTKCSRKVENIYGQIRHAITPANENQPLN